MKYSWLFLLLATSAIAGNTSVLFSPGSVNPGPFPSDSLTVPDSTQKTGLRVQLPTPNGCPSGLGACANQEMINHFDGFNPNARITVCFSGPIDVSSVTGSIFFTPIAGGSSTPINQAIFDPASNCLYAKPDVVLSQGTKYLLSVTDAVLDSDGKAVKAEGQFTSCINSGKNAYCAALQDAIGKNKGKTIVAASIFTTMSVSDWLEKARETIYSSTPELVMPAGSPYVFPLSNVSKMTWRIDSGPVATQDLPTNLPNVDSIAFGLFLSPIYLATSGPAAGSIPYTPTNQAVAPSSLVVPVSFHVYLPPANKMPDGGGFPVVIFGHGLGDNQFGAPAYMASTLAQFGFATVAIEITGHGFGPGSTVQVTDNQGGTYPVATPGRGINLGSGIIGPTDGCILPGPLAIRDCVRQTVVDLMQFTRALNDFQGFGLGLNPNKVYYVGQSLGSIYGTMLQAVEPRIRAAVINAGGGSQADVARLSMSGRPLGNMFLNYTNPGLFNVPPAPSETYFHDYFNDNYPYRGSPFSNAVPGAIEIQSAFEQAEWIVMPGDALGYGRMLRDKRTAFQFGTGDLEVPNPTESALVRAANGENSSWLLRMDEAAKADPSLLGVMMPGFPLPILPHRVLSNPTIFQISSENSLAIAEQMQAAQFFQSEGKTLPDPNNLLRAPFVGKQLFEKGVLPDTLNYLQITR